MCGRFWVLQDVSNMGLLDIMICPFLFSLLIRLLYHVAVCFISRWPPRFLLRASSMGYVYRCLV